MAATHQLLQHRLTSQLPAPFPMRRVSSVHFLAALALHLCFHCVCQALCASTRHHKHLPFHRGLTQIYTTPQIRDQANTQAHSARQPPCYSQAAPAAGSASSTCATHLTRTRHDLALVMGPSVASIVPAAVKAVYRTVRLQAGPWFLASRRALRI